MSKAGYNQFFKAAQEARKSDGPSKKKKAAIPKVSTAVSEEQREVLLRKAFRVQRSRSQFPWGAALVLVLSLLSAGFYLIAPQKVERIFAAFEFLPMGQAIAAEEKPGGKAADKSKENASPGEKSASAHADHKAGPDLIKNDEVKGNISHFTKLKDRKEELDQREKELTELEEELQRQKVELERRVVQLEEMRTQIAATLKDRVEVDQEKVNKLVDLYSNMKPKQAADVIGNLNDDLAIEVLAKMKKKNAAEIMNLIPADKARALSEKYTGYRRRLAGA